MRILLIIVFAGLGAYSLRRQTRPVRFLEEFRVLDRGGELYDVDWVIGTLHDIQSTATRTEQRSMRASFNPHMRHDPFTYADKGQMHYRYETSVDESLAVEHESGRLPMTFRVHRSGTWEWAYFDPGCEGKTLVAAWIRRRGTAESRYLVMMVDNFLLPGKGLTEGAESDLVAAPSRWGIWPAAGLGAAIGSAGVLGTGVFAALFGALLFAGIYFLVLALLRHRRGKAFSDVEMPKFREFLRTRGRNEAPRDPAALPVTA